MKKGCIFLSAIMALGMLGACDDGAATKTFSNVYFDSATLTYNGSLQTLRPSGFPEGTTVTYVGESAYKDAGSYELTVKLSKTGYEEKTLTATLTIAKALLKVTASSCAGLYGENFTPDYTVTGFVGGDTLADVDVLPQFTGTLGAEIGTYRNALSFGRAQDNNYEFLYEAGDYVVNAYKTYEEDGVSYLAFGQYPQTVVSDEALIEALDSGIRQGTVTLDTATGWYEYEGFSYARMTATPHTYEENYGKFANGEEIVAGETYYFAVEPIVWRVLSDDEGKLFVTTETLLDVQKFHSTIDTATKDGASVYANNWEYSDLRAWLNGEFTALAFGAPLGGYVETALVENGADVARANDRYTACADTQDKVFLLSYKDVCSEEYGFDADDGVSASRAVTVSDYARARGAFMPTGESGYWWLRCGSDVVRAVEVVMPDGDASYDYFQVVNESCCIRPAMYFYS